MQLLYATSNPAKYTAMRDALQPLDISLLCLRDMEQVPVAPEEGQSPLENARQKALFYYDHYGIPLFSCDSGLYLENLPRELQPGLHVRSPQGVYLDDQAMQDYYGGLAAHEAVQQAAEGPLGVPGLFGFFIEPRHRDRPPLSRYVRSSVTPTGQWSLPMISGKMSAPARLSRRRRDRTK